MRGPNNTLVSPKKPLQVTPLMVSIDPISEYSFKYGYANLTVESVAASELIFEHAEINVFYGLLYKAYNQAGWAMLLANQEFALQKDVYYSISFPIQDAKSGSAYIIYQRSKLFAGELRIETMVIAAYHEQPYVVEGRFDDKIGMPMEKETGLLKKKVISGIVGIGGFPFTTRELDILELINIYKSDYVAEQFHISPLTLRTHCRNIVGKAKLISPYLETAKDVSRYFHNLGLI
jgi:hypothetical protein